MSQTKAQLIDNLVQPITGALGSASAPTFSFTSDPNTGLYSPGADQVVISTNGTGRITIDGSGNINIDSNTFYVDATNNRVGIGITTPSDTLQVNGGITFGADTAPSGRSRIYESSGLRLNTGGGAGGRPLIFEISSVEKARVDTSGRLLIGTSTARSDAKVQIAGYQSWQTSSADASSFRISKYV